MVTRISGICAGVLLSLLVSVFIFPRSASQVATPPSCDVFRSGFCVYNLPQQASLVVLCMGCIRACHNTQPRTTTPECGPCLHIH